jgi:hypothetical protein
MAGPFPFWGTTCLFLKYCFLCPELILVFEKRRAEKTPCVFDNGTHVTLQIMYIKNIAMVDDV